MSAGGLQTSRERSSNPSQTAPARFLQRQCACGTHTPLGEECDTCRMKKSAGRVLQRVAITSGRIDEIPPSVEDVLSSPGRSLDPVTRGVMESRFGHDFTGVRIHTDVKAIESARAVNAHAYTVGDRIVFDEGRYAPGTTAGRRLLAHELTHVVQQTGESTGLMRQSDSAGYGIDPSPAAERQADLAADAVVENRPVTTTIPRMVRGALQRQPVPATAAVMKPKRTPVESSFEVLKRAWEFSKNGNHAKALEYLNALQDFLNRIDSPKSFDRQFGDVHGMSQTHARVMVNEARSAVRRLLDGYRLETSPPESTWKYSIHIYGLALPTLYVLAGEKPSSSLPVYKPVGLSESIASAYAGFKKAAYAKLIDGLKGFRSAQVGLLRGLAGKLPSSMQPVAHSIVDVYGFICDMWVGLVLAIVGLVVGFVEGIVGLIVAVCRLAYGVLKLLADALAALLGKPEALQADLDALKAMLDNFWPGLKKAVGDWWARYQAETPEKQVLMGSELVGEVEALIATFAFTGAKAGSIPSVTAKVPYPVIRVAEAAGVGAEEMAPVVQVTWETATATVKVGEPAVAMATAVPAMAKVAGAGGGGSSGGGGGRRPSWKESERDVGNHLGNDFQPQKGFRDGKQVNRNSFGQVIPDFYNAAKNIAIEVKNYDLVNNLSDLIAVLVEQGGGRMAYMRKGVRQWLFLDIRGQAIADPAATALEIQTKTGGKTIFQRIYYITDSGIQQAL